MSNKSPGVSPRILNWSPIAEPQRKVTGRRTRGNTSDEVFAAGMEKPQLER